MTQKKQPVSYPAPPLPEKIERWTAALKAQAVAAVSARTMTTAQLWERYGVSAEEFASWKWLRAIHGERALKTTRLQWFRRRN